MGLIVTTIIGIFAIIAICMIEIAKRKSEIDFGRYLFCWFLLLFCLGFFAISFIVSVLR